MKNEIKENIVESSLDIKEKIARDLVNDYEKVFSYYLRSHGEIHQPAGQPKENMASLIKRTIELISMKDEEEKKSIKGLLEKIEKVKDNSYDSLVYGLGIREAIETPLYRLRKLAVEEMEKNNPEIAREYTKTIL